VVTQVPLQLKEQVVDIVGTGGDKAHTFNISTTCAFVVAGAGGRVAKHGNRSVSSRSGSADVLEAAGIALNLTPMQIATCIEEIGVGFMFAPAHHQATSQVAALRKELGIRTLFNLIGPLTNPAAVIHQLVGVFAAKWTHPVAEVLQRLGSHHALVVHSDDGLDEISINAATSIVELQHNRINAYQLTPEQFGIKRTPLDALRVTSKEESLALMMKVLQNEPGAARDIVILNAGAAIYAADLAASIAEGIEKAEETIANGAAYQKFKALREFTGS
jgi:anthranilate phosphoribosyltransferase